MRTYFIVSHFDQNGKEYWRAHKRGFHSAFNVFDFRNSVSYSVSYNSPDECEEKLRRILDPVKPEIVRIVRI